MILAVVSIVHKYKKAHDGLIESTKDFQALSAQQTQPDITLWTSQAEKADKRRASRGVEAMDIYETQEQTGMSSPLVETSWLTGLQLQARLASKLTFVKKNFGHENRMV